MTHTSIHVVRHRLREILTIWGRDEFHCKRCYKMHLTRALSRDTMTIVGQCRQPCEGNKEVRW